VTDEPPEWQGRAARFQSDVFDQPIRPIAPSLECESDRICALEAIIEQKDQLLADYEQNVRAFHEQMSEMDAALARAEKRVEELTTEICASEAASNKIIHRVKLDNDLLSVDDRNLRAQLRQKDRKIAALAIHLPDLARELDGVAPHATLCHSPMNELSNANPQEKQILWLFYHGEDLESIADMTGLKQEEVFRMLQRLIVPATSELENEIDVPRQWAISTDMLRDPVRRSEHLWQCSGTCSPPYSRLFGLQPTRQPGLAADGAVCHGDGRRECGASQR
jgi:hypothetical protein